ncbi:unnamed protein product [marine sediment metagenome]|uniref:Uncharacterized protein n=1 Tax=marine sediment metagenome TaxID=412755 RepID=X1EB30_9ZZZZ
MRFTNEWINGSAAARYLCNSTNEAYVRRRYASYSEHLKGEWSLCDCKTLLEEILGDGELEKLENVL